MKLILYFLMWILLSSEMLLAGGGSPGQKPQFIFSNPIDTEGGEFNIGFNVRFYPDPPLAGAVMSATKIEWDVRKPQIYATNGIVLIVITNKTAQITFSGAENAKKDGVEIPTYYGFSETGGYLPTDPQQDVIIGEEAIEEKRAEFNFVWIPAEDLNHTSFTVSPPQNTLITKTFFVWNKIEVGKYTPPGEYRDPNGFLITLTFE